MYTLATIQDLIQITPEQLKIKSSLAVKDSINAKYANKVVPNVGLCICIWDILGASEGLIGHGTGLVNVNVDFRMLTFRPFRGEVLQAQIKRSDESGIILSLNFTVEVFVHPSQLPKPSTFSQDEKVWVWDSEGTELFFDHGEPVLFRVVQEEWHDQEPNRVKKDQYGKTNRDKDSSWRIQGSMAQPGLGPTLWWSEADDGQAADEAMSDA
ncbi:hypothetical protein EJ04DRAFT_529585 [Polyplosphaeria fusca]|uniref:DNA-directed RNA polymerase subunit n=1 Tax=Polyplosphaeria fusca TaxID=682080 RepID=A0A9P4QKB4_9PLEO|nr:hypothetical protein EJ04DRAFT_529585 [Polyplosphaeria fusca]